MRLIFSVSCAPGPGRRVAVESSVMQLRTPLLPFMPLTQDGPRWVGHADIDEFGARLLLPLLSGCSCVLCVCVFVCGTRIGVGACACVRVSQTACLCCHDRLADKLLSLVMVSPASFCCLHSHAASRPNYYHRLVCGV